MIHPPGAVPVKETTMQIGVNGMKATYAVKFESSRPVGDWKNTVTLKRKWALVRMGRIGFTVLSRFGSKEAAERAKRRLEFLAALGPCGK